MQRFFGFILIIYFSLGTLLLPQGDFSTLPDMPRMYVHCRDTEDSDMDLPDFITEHLFQINDLMGETPDPNDKPHQPVEFHHIYTPIMVTLRLVVSDKKTVIAQKKETIVFDEKYLSDYPAYVFRPPMA